MTVDVDDTLHAEESAPAGGDDATLGASGPPRRRAGDEPVRLGRYVVLERLGAGGMGGVYSAYDPDLDRKVAIKLILPEQSQADAQARLLREAQAMARLRHPNVVAVHDTGEAEGRVYLAMDFIRGRTLRDWLDERARDWRETLALFIEIARGLAAAHDAGLVHRDFKPDNVLLDEEGRPLVTDFGLARTSPGGPTDGLSASRAVELTLQGKLVGTPAYMAPEQFAAAATDGRTDQFAFCIALWEGLYGARPFAGANIAELATHVLDGSVAEPPPGRRVPTWLHRVVARGLAAAPENRWPSMRDMLAQFDLGARFARRQKIAMGAVAVGTFGAVMVAARELDVRRRAAACRTAAAEIEAVWNGDRKSALRQAVLATEVSNADATFANAVPWVDDWTARWADMREEVCRAAEIEHRESPEFHAAAAVCLDERRAELDVLLEVLADPDPIVVHRIVPAVARLPPRALHRPSHRGASGFDGECITRAGPRDARARPAAREGARCGRQVRSWPRARDHGQATRRGDPGCRAPGARCRGSGSSGARRR